MVTVVSRDGRTNTRGTVNDRGTYTHATVQGPSANRIGTNVILKVPGRDRHTGAFLDADGDTTHAYLRMYNPKIDVLSPGWLTYTGFVRGRDVAEFDAAVAGADFNSVDDGTLTFIPESWHVMVHDNADFAERAANGTWDGCVTVPADYNPGS